MWGQIFLEASIQQNFNFGFSTHKSDVLIHLSQWQYWWWFWFSLVWVVYYYVIVTDASKRSLTFNPVLNTSLRSHGKWGDFLVALIPLSWCGNILVNSNFILRIIEWQNESSLFTLRIQGKQWYWVYKYDGNAAIMIDSAPKNIGHDRWFTNIAGESYCADSYYQTLHLAAQLEFQDTYKIELTKADTGKKTMDASTLYTNHIYTPDIKNLNDNKDYHHILNINYFATEPVYTKNINENSNDSNFIKKNYTGNFNEFTKFNANNLEHQKLLEKIEKVEKTAREHKNFYFLPEEFTKDFNSTSSYTNNNKENFYDNDHSFFDYQYNIDEPAVDNNIIVESEPYKDDIFFKKFAKCATQEFMKTWITWEEYAAAFLKTYNRPSKTTHWRTEAGFIYSKYNLLKNSRLLVNDIMSLANADNFIDLYNNKTQIQHYDLIKIDDTQNTQGNMRILLTNNSILLHAGILNDHVIDVLKSPISLKTPLLFTVVINNNLLESKINPTEDLWGFRQKRYRRLKEFKFSPKIIYDPNTFQPIDLDKTVKTYNLLLNNQRKTDLETEIKPTEYVGKLSYRASSDQPYTPTTLEAQKTQVTNTNNAYYFYSSLKLNKKRSEALSVNLARRLLRTKRTLVLPVHVNITVITNSYDVVHSWFIPGLGLKLDCVPGRSTHHTLYVDNVGFYYGQCAEICGRYHHHMPIRVCAIPFEQFLVWWHTKGLPRTLRLHQNKLSSYNTSDKITLHRAFIQYRYNF